MLLIGSDDGVYRLPVSDGTTPTTKVLDSGRVKRLETFEGVDGAFAATETGLYRTRDGDRWTDLGVPEGEVYSVGAGGDGERLYAGTRPAHVYVTESVGADDVEWRECRGFQELPSREEWGLERHDYVSQVRDVRPDPATPDRLVAGVEVGGVHVSKDGGETWSDRADGVHDDVHELRVVEPGTYVAATGFGLFRSADAGRTWTRLDDEVPQRYFRSVCAVDGVVYAGSALKNSSTWDDPDADPALFAVDDGSLEPVPIPRDDETVTGMTVVGGDLLVATHRGSLFRRDDGGWTDLGTFPVDEDVTGRYTPVTTFEA